VRSIIGQIRPDRQTLLFSATMPRKVENLVRDALTTPVRITVGEVGAANEDIKQARFLATMLTVVSAALAPQLREGKKQGRNLRPRGVGMNPWTRGCGLNIGEEALDKLVAKPGH
jgi:hypothetical protein